MSQRPLFPLLGREPAALLFDLDGTLIDSVPDLANALDITLKHAGFPGAGEQLTRAWVGNGARKLLQRALAHAQSIAEDQVGEQLLEELLPVFFDAYDQACTERTVLYSGVQTALERWHKKGIKLACVTNKPERFARKIIQHFQLDDIMPVVLGGDSLPHKKPEPQPLWAACEQLGVPVDASIMVGDSRNDVLAARAAGMPVVAVPYGYNYGSDIAEMAPDLIVESLDTLS